MASKYGSYTQLRDIAVKRAGRLAAAGLAQAIHIPTVKELKLAGVAPATAIKNLEAYLNAPTKVSEARKLTTEQRPVFVPTPRGVEITSQAEEKKLRQRLQARERSRRYRERVRNLTEQDQIYRKAAATLGVYIAPADAKAFTEYMDYRFAQGGDKVTYKMNLYLKNFVKLMKTGYKPDEIVKDFQQYMADRAALENRADSMTGFTPDEVDTLFKDFANG